MLIQLLLQSQTVLMLGNLFVNKTTNGESMESASKLILKMKVERSTLSMCLQWLKNLVEISFTKGKQQKLIAYMIIIPITMAMLQHITKRWVVLGKKKRQLLNQIQTQLTFMYLSLCLSRYRRSWPLSRLLLSPSSLALWASCLEIKSWIRYIHPLTLKNFRKINQK